MIENKLLSCTMRTDSTEMYEQRTPMLFKVLGSNVATKSPK